MIASRSILLSALLILLFGTNCRVLDEAPPQQPPNLVLIISDDQRWTDYGFMGHEHIQTPNLDRLASEGVLFRHGYVTSSLCRPSLATIVTGLYPHQHRLTSNDPPKGQPREVLTRYIDRVPTLPKLLADRGYLSFQSGKWWEGSYQRGGFTHGMTRGTRHGDDGLAIGREGMEEVFSFVDESVEEQRPFFLWYAPFLPHQPHNPPARLLKRYADVAPSPYHARYWAMCEWFDETCGELLDFLDERELADNTLVLFVCDNGWIPRQDSKRFAPRSKRSPYDGGLRTPIIARWPANPRGLGPGESSALASSIDLAPTILSAAGLPSTRDMQGLDLFDSPSLAKRGTIFGDIYAHDAVDPEDPVSSLRYRWCIDDRWKLIVPQSSDEAMQLFDLAEDPFEKQDRSSDFPDRARSLSRRIDAWWPAKSGP